jgi:hypothetical protein
VTVQLSSLPRGLQTQVVQQRYFVQALSMALTGHDQHSMAELAQELRTVAANVSLAVDDAKARGGDGDWHDGARIAAIQSLAAATGASMLDGASAALRRSEQHRLEFVAQTKRALSRVQQTTPEALPPSTDPQPAPVEMPAPPDTGRSATAR